MSGLPALAEVKKLLVYVAGVAGAAVATGLLPAHVAAIVDAVLGLLTGAGIYKARNADPRH